jgi:hypothetical protein
MPLLLTRDKQAAQGLSVRGKGDRTRKDCRFAHLVQ